MSESATFHSLKRQSSGRRGSTSTPPGGVSKDQDLLLQGIFHGSKAFTGPEQVVIDLTNNCNNNCIACWTGSPLLGELAPDSDWKSKELSFEVASRTIERLARLGTKRVRFTGGGEPFLHPKILELISTVKNKNISCDVTTNFTPLNEDMLRKLVDIGLNSIAVSLWAASAETYAKVHPNKTEKTFGRIRSLLEFLASIKDDRPEVVICNVIFSLNYKEVVEMFDFARKVGAERLYYTVADVVPGKTERLLPSPEERRELLELVEVLKDRLAFQAGKRPVRVDYFEGFLRRISGEAFSTSGDYDARAVDSIPCYIGWAFARILANGDVCPCCRGVAYPMGNLNRQNFEEIWNSSTYEEFRVKAKTLSKAHPYFRKMGCQKSCDNLMHNEEIHRRLGVRSSHNT